ncbi:replicative DNA helicase [Janthinobacterium sp.]|uniref:replicative DNA helicase n=1 Tax=Janthinobacterium sp. TaxID=1871054 RepID=UPI00293D37F7|nr:replicative DNA helicase [Janthinobacterium sp.]
MSKVVTLNIQDETQLRVPPHSIEAESSVLGGLLLDNKTFSHLEDLIASSDFYRLEHRLVFTSIAQLVSEGKPADVITVNEWLNSNGLLEQVGGLHYLNSLAQYVPSASNIRRYAEIVREKAVLRKLISVGDEISSSAFSIGRDTSEILEDAERNVLAIAQQGNRALEEAKSLDSQLIKFLDNLQDKADGKDVNKGVFSGFTDLDKVTDGFQPGDLIVVAGRPSMGKTSMAMNIAEHAAFQQGLPVLVFSLEMSAHQLTTRIVGSVGRIDQSNLKKADLTEAEWTRVAEATQRMHGKVIDIQDTNCETVAAVRSAARRAAYKHKNLGLVVVDYIQLLSSGTSEENRATEVAQVSRGLKLLAGELGCPVIALSQLNRSLESRGDKRPMMSDLRESGAIEQDADTIIFIYRDEVYTKEACREPGVAEIIVAKQRNGPVGNVKLAWSPNYTRFDSLAY